MPGKKNHSLPDASQLLQELLESFTSEELTFWLSKVTNCLACNLKDHVGKWNLAQCKTSCLERIDFFIAVETELNTRFLFQVEHSPYTLLFALRVASERVPLEVEDPVVQGLALHFHSKNITELDEKRMPFLYNSSGVPDGIHEGKWIWPCSSEQTKILSGFCRHSVDGYSKTNHRSNQEIKNTK